MNLQRLTLRLPAADVPLAESLLMLAGAESVEFRDAGDTPVLEPAPDTTPLWPDVVTSALFPASASLERLVRLLRDRCRASDVSVTLVQPESWQRALSQQIKAKPIGKRVWLAPSDDKHVPADRICVRLHMGFAFGTGEHATTSLCLDWLEACLTPGATVLDYGCGSGVLAITALALGARYAWAVDNDAQALDATAANAELNGVRDRLFIGSPEALPDVTADALVANILAQPLVELAPKLAAHVHDGGAIVLSGVLEAQAQRVTDAYAPYCKNFETAARDGWIRLSARRTRSNHEYR